jgi:hypothetical protein
MAQRSLQFQRDCLVKSSSLAFGAVAQLGERLNGIQEVSGSIPLSSTIPGNRLRFPGFSFSIQSLVLLLLLSGCPEDNHDPQQDAGTLLSRGDSGPDAPDANASPTDPIISDGGTIVPSPPIDSGFTLPAPCNIDNTYAGDVESLNTLHTFDGGAPYLCVDGSVKIKETAWREIRLPNVQIITGDVVLYKNHLAESISFPDLVDINGELYVGLNTNLEQLTFPQLTKAGRFVFQSNEHLIHLDGFDRLQETKDIIIQQQETLTHISLPLLIAVDGFVSIASNPILANLDFTELVRTNASFQIFSNAHLPTTNFPALSHIGTDFRIEYNNLLDSFDFGTISYIGGNVTFARNYALEQCLVEVWFEAIESQFTVNGSIDITENNSENECP